MPVCRKITVENFYEPCILFMLLQNPSYGYDLKNSLENKCGCMVDLGNLYRKLAKMTKNGFVIKKKGDSKIGPERQVYEITKQGEQHLQQWMDGLQNELTIISKLLHNYKKYHDRGNR